jgi:pimeloyl-ACP methyl ester carboxylesterase
MLKSIVHQQKKLSYQLYGEGPYLLFLHGFCEDHRMWSAFLDDFSADYQLLIPDLPGFGKSEAHPKISIAAMAEAIYAILQAEKIEKVAWIGHSMGGYVGLAFSELYPDQLSGLCLFHSHPLEDSEEKKKNRRKSMDFIEEHGAQKFVEQLIPMLFSSRFRLLQKPLIKTFVEIAKEQSQTGILAATDAMIERPDRSIVLRNTYVPVLSILGKQDQVIPEDISWMNLAPSSSSVIIEEAGHMGFLEATEACQAALLAWLEGLEFY